MRYPIFVFEKGDGDLIVYDTPAQHRKHLEPYDLESNVAFDSLGHLLTMTEGRDRVEIAESDAQPDPERLREMLIQALQRVGQQWSSDASLASLISAAQATCGYKPGSIGQAISSLLRFLGLRRTKS